MPERYNPAAHVDPGHPLYDKIRKEVEAEHTRRINDPEHIRQIRESIDRKIEAVRKQYEWERSRGLAPK